MQVGTLAIQLIFDKDVLYEVPLYQRPYVWQEEEQWQPLWDDIRKLAEALLANQPSRAHFLGATVQEKVVVPPGTIERRLVIDGQQRLTTLQLLVKAIHDALVGRDDRYIPAFAKLWRNAHPLSTAENEKWKIYPTNADRNDFRKIMETTSPAALLKSHGANAATRALGRNLIDGYLFFVRQAAEWLEEVGIEAGAAALYGAIRDNIRLVVIDLDDKDDAQLIFETLNARGTPLLAADLVKNALLGQLPPDARENAYLQHWQDFDKDVAFWRADVGRGHAQRKRVETFLQYALTVLTREEVSAAHLYAAYRDFSASGRAGDAREQMRAIHRLGTIYKDLVERRYHPRTNLFLERLQTMGFESAYPFLIALLDRLAGEDDAILAILQDLESFLVRRMVARLNTRGYNRFFIDLIGALDSETDPEALILLVRTRLLAGSAEVDVWPADDHFEHSWKSYPLYLNLTRPRLRMLLEALEMGLKDDFAETEAVPRNLSVEHVLPQGWQTHWPLPADAPEGSKERRDVLLHTIGNLTLLKQKLNSSQQNYPWHAGEDTPSKKAKLEEYSVLHLNKALCRSDVWDEAAIENRSNVLFGVARTLWPRPEPSAG